MNPIYLDYNATTPVDPAVFRAMLPYLGSGDDALSSFFGNASSSHALGKQTHDAVARARGQVADLIGAAADEIVFTGCGSEANNLALKGIVLAADSAAGIKDAHVITSAVEHPAILQPCNFLRRLGCRVSVLSVDRQGRVDPAALERSLDQRTTLVSIMHANNEVGTLQPIREIAELAHRRGVLVHTDAAQSIGKIPVDVKALGVDLLTIAGHKLYAPKGIGALYVRRGVKLEPLIHGAGHEGGRRAGTENVPYIVGLGEACQLARQALPQATEELRAKRDRLWELLHKALGERAVLNGDRVRRLPNTLNVCILCSHSGAELLAQLPEIAASTGSACHEGQVKMSPVLAAMGVPEQIGRGAIRLSVGRFTTLEEIDRAAAGLIRVAITSGERGA